MADAFQKVRSTFNVSRVAQAGALAALADQAHSRSILERTRIERERIMAGIARLGCEAFPSVGNFVSARTPKPRSEEQTSELKSLMRLSYAVFCLKKQKQK